MLSLTRFSCARKAQAMLISFWDSAQKSRAAPGIKIKYAQAMALAMRQQELVEALRAQDLCVTSDEPSGTATRAAAVCA